MIKKAGRSLLKKIHVLLREKEARDEQSLFIAEGLKVVRDMATKGFTPETIIISGTFSSNADNKDLLFELNDRATSVLEVSDQDFEKLSILRHPQGILAVAKKPLIPSTVPDYGSNALLVLCDGIQDPGNLGTIIRSSAALGADSVLLTGDNADIYNPRVVRASSGAILDIPVRECSIEDIDKLKSSGYRLLSSNAGENNAINISELKNNNGRVILAFGSEGRGVSEKIQLLSDALFNIPVPGSVESLNVTAAAAISLYVIRNP